MTSTVRIYYNILYLYYIICVCTYTYNIFRNAVRWWISFGEKRIGIFFFFVRFSIIYHVIFIFSFQRYCDGFHHISSTYTYYMYVALPGGRFLATRMTVEKIWLIPFRRYIYMKRKRERIMNIINVVLSDIPTHNIQHTAAVCSYQNVYIQLDGSQEEVFFCDMI